MLKQSETGLSTTTTHKNSFFNQRLSPRDAFNNVCSWGRRHPGDAIVCSGIVVMAIAVAVVLTSSSVVPIIAGLLLVVLAGFLLGGKVCFPDDDYTDHRFSCSF